MDVYADLATTHEESHRADNQTQGRSRLPSWKIQKSKAVAVKEEGRAESKSPALHEVGGSFCRSLSSLRIRFDAMDPVSSSLNHTCLPAHDCSWPPFSTSWHPLVPSMRCSGRRLAPRLHRPRSCHAALCPGCTARPAAPPRAKPLLPLQGLRRESGRETGQMEEMTRRRDMPDSLGPVISQGHFCQFNKNLTSQS